MWVRKLGVRTNSDEQGPKRFIGGVNLVSQFVIYWCNFIISLALSLCLYLFASRTLSHSLSIYPFTYLIPWNLLKYRRKQYICSIVRFLSGDKTKDVFKTRTHQNKNPNIFGYQLAWTRTGHIWKQQQSPPPPTPTLKQHRKITSQHFSSQMYLIRMLPFQTGQLVCSNQQEAAVLSSVRPSRFVRACVFVMSHSFNIK